MDALPDIPVEVKSPVMTPNFTCRMTALNSTFRQSGKGTGDHDVAGGTAQQAADNAGSILVNIAEAGNSPTPEW